MSLIDFSRPGASALILEVETYKNIIKRIIKEACNSSPVYDVGKYDDYEIVGSLSITTSNL